jgi:hypothetical protein
MGFRAVSELSPVVYFLLAAFNLPMILPGN